MQANLISKNSKNRIVKKQSVDISALEEMNFIRNPKERMALSLIGTGNLLAEEDAVFGRSYTTTV
jgi:hypothetical protein